MDVLVTDYGSVVQFAAETEAAEHFFNRLVIESYQWIGTKLVPTRSSWYGTNSIGTNSFATDYRVAESIIAILKHEGYTVAHAA